jgi:predicted  nucleic acid-binding Zn-ribbon protein
MSDSDALGEALLDQVLHQVRILEAELENWKRLAVKAQSELAAIVKELADARDFQRGLQRKIRKLRQDRSLPPDDVVDK